MRFLQLVLVGVMCAAVASTAAAVVAYSEDFNYDAGTGWDVLEWEVDGGDPYFNGSGQWVMEGPGDGMNRGVEGGDFVMNVEWSTVNMAPENQGWSVFWYSFDHNGDQGQYYMFNMDSWYDGSSEQTGLYIDAFSSTVGGNVYAEDIGVLTSLELQVEYDSSAGTYSFSRAVNGGAMTAMCTIDGYDAPDDTRVEAFWADSETSDLSVEFDNYGMVPEPATLALLSLGGIALIRRRK
jgi:hypothetical protein